ncbi:MAG: efflux RND transporter periplasmic adaptor subunit [Syntrophobacteraceae bacterium]|nr:efflux RND transporter periplasmic adaptor subunit [Syntrophobacteraceae bacterium]
MSPFLKKHRFAAIAVLLAVIAGGVVYAITSRPQSIVLTGIVDTDQIQVGPLVQGRLQKLLVDRGDAVEKGRLLAVIQPQELEADSAFYKNSEKQYAAQKEQAQADLEYLQAQTREQIRQAKASLAMHNADVAQAVADLDYARHTLDRAKKLRASNANSVQELDHALSNYNAAVAHVESLRKQVKASEAALALAEANTVEIGSRKAALTSSLHHLAAARAQTEKANVVLGYTEIRAPLSGIVDVRVSLQGEVVSPGQTIVTLIDPDNLWVRADVPESYIDRIRLGERLTVRLPSGATRVGAVFYRGVDADYATQRDVSQTKRDIKTFQIRLRCDNRDRRLAMGMTAYVILPVR